MKFIDKLERKFGRFGIPNLTVYIVVCYVIGYALMIVNPSLLNWLSLEPAYILRGQIWRLVTWVLYPPDSSNVLLFALMVLFFYYPIGTSLERTLGTFKYTLYILSGMVFTILGAFILYFILGGNVLVGSVFSTYYISLSTFLAYAMCYPEMQVLLMFIIPIKDEMDGNFLCCDRCLRNDSVYYGRRMVSGDPHCGFTVEFYYLLLWKQGLQQI